MRKKLHFQTTLPLHPILKNTTNLKYKYISKQNKVCGYLVSLTLPLHCIFMQVGPKHEFVELGILNVPQL